MRDTHCMINCYAIHTIVEPHCVWRLNAPCRQRLASACWQHAVSLWKEVQNHTGDMLLHWFQLFENTLKYLCACFGWFRVFLRNRLRNWERLDSASDTCQARLTNALSPVWHVLTRGKPTVCHVHDPGSWKRVGGNTRSAAIWCRRVSFVLVVGHSENILFRRNSWSYIH